MADSDDLARADAAARSDALDVSRSWLVQAPAGSGKTELLIARFLALLAIVDRPEAVVAMTFTRKAAAEMRERVVAALHAATAAASDGPEPALPHAALTRRLAHAALARDRQQRWRLLEQPSRLRIITIDAMATSIARQAPVASSLGALPRFVDDAEILYRDAARDALAAAPANDARWQTFLRWMDNDAMAATRLIAQMLAARDRWPIHLFAEDPDALRADVEHALRWEIRRAVQTVRHRLPDTLAQSLHVHARHATEHFATAGELPDFATELARLARTGDVPPDDDATAWLALADWLLTSTGGFARGITHRHGFPAAGNGPGAAVRVSRKADFARWLLDAADVPGLAESWHNLRVLPPATYAGDAWSFVVAAMHVLPAAADALRATIAARGQSDFTEATLRALTALGTDDDPSELLLAIDYRLSHLLIDEFQDTSRAQLALIGRLTAGWEAGDGRTIFAVGDPMQSIYRFRQAEVRLFIEAQDAARVANVPVGVVELTRNFRSQRSIVAWVNHVFAQVLPRVSDATRGDAGYRPAYADASTGTDVEPSLDLVRTRADEAAAVVARVTEALSAGLGRVAVLVRARSHAQALLPALRDAGIAFSAVELEGLYDRLATRDVLSLARALAQPADRLAWLAILRAPWCGLILADLLIVADASSHRPVVAALLDAEVIRIVSPSARQRIERLLVALRPALAARGRYGFASLVRSAWIAIGGPACATPFDRAGVDRVLSLLAEQERGGDVTDHDRLLALAERLYAETGDVSAPGVQLMTLHRAKGLQFDAVVLPGLDADTGGGGQPVLRWKARDIDGSPSLVLAPMRARMGTLAAQDPMYRWLGTLDAAEEVAELGRLLYVGATRAKRRLHLVAVAAPAPDGLAWKRPARGTPLGRLWSALNLPALSAASAAPADAADTLPTGDPLVRMSADWTLPPLPAPLPRRARVPLRREEAPVFDWADAVAAAIGTVAHRLLAQIAVDGLDAWDERRLQREHARIRAELGSEGLEADLRPRAAQRVAAVIARTLSDPRGRWLFAATHDNAHSEWALAADDGGEIVHIVVDRSFVADGTRYVVDFKTGSHLGGDAASFLGREFERYRPQLERYARVVRALEARPVRIALYHPLVDGGWQERDAP
ncbi:MAG: UvrD-helicase domain-containing protein [Betaproteobacteria bacterium]